MGQRMRGRPGHGITGRDAAEYVEGIAKALGTDLKKRYDLERARDVFSNGMPLSKIVREMRDSQWS
jgi:NAD-specific glutamate dehydrogenase